MCNEYPRVRLDRIRRPTKIVWDGPPTLQEEPEDSDSCPMEITLNSTLYNELGKLKLCIHLTRLIKQIAPSIIILCLLYEYARCNNSMYFTCRNLLLSSL